MLVQAEVEGERLSDDEIVRFAMLMIFAGGETVEKTLATFVRNLVAHATQLATLHADWTLFDRALAESLALPLRPIWFRAERVAKLL